MRDASRHEAEDHALDFRGEVRLLRVRFGSEAGEGGQLYGSVSARDVGDALHAQGFIVERAQILLNAPVKMLGNFKTAVRLHPDVKVEIEFTVARSMEEGNLKIAEAAQLLERAEDAQKLMGEEAVEEAPADDVEEDEDAQA